MIKIDDFLRKLERYNPREKRYEPLKIVARLRTPVLLSHPWLHLDGLIAHLVLRKLLGAQYMFLPTNLPLDIFSRIHLPLKLTTYKDKSIYHASISFFDINIKFTTTIYKRFEQANLHRLNSRKKKIHKGSGKLREYRMKVAYVPAREISFFANGDLIEIEDLLKCLPGFGKKTSIGFGFFKSISVTSIRQDRSIIHAREAMRPIPLEWVKSNKIKEKALLGYKFPYWAKQNVCLCIPPGEEAWMKDG